MLVRCWFHTWLIQCLLCFVSNLALLRIWVDTRSADLLCVMLLVNRPRQHSWSCRGKQRTPHGSPQGTPPIEVSAGFIPRRSPQGPPKERPPRVHFKESPQEIDRESPVGGFRMGFPTGSFQGSPPPRCFSALPQGIPPGNPPR